MSAHTPLGVSDAKVRIYSETTNNFLKIIEFRGIKSTESICESICKPIRNQENLPVHILEKLHADSCILRSSYQGRTSSVPKTYVLAMENVRFWYGEHKTQLSAQRNHGELNTLDMDFTKFVRLFQVIV